MKNLSLQDSKRRENIHLAVMDLIEATYDSGWLSGKIEALANSTLVLPEGCREEHQRSIVRRNAKKSDLLAMINATFELLPEVE